MTSDYYVDATARNFMKGRTATPMGDVPPHPGRTSRAASARRYLAGEGAAGSAAGPDG
jgi:hypothetical protein